MKHWQRRRWQVLGLGCGLVGIGLIGRGFALPPEPRQAAIEAASVVLDRYSDALKAMPGVSAVGVGLMGDGTTVGVQVYHQAGAAGAAPQTLDGVPVQVLQGGPFRAHGGNESAGQTPLGRPNHTGVFALPVPMGVSTGNKNGRFAGTLGYRVREVGNPAVVGYLTNNHVAAASGPHLCPAQLNPPVLPDFLTAECQPGLFDARGACGSPSIGGLVQVIPLIMGGLFTQTVDAAFVRSERGCVSSTILEVGSPNQPPVFPQLGDVLDLSGRTSAHAKIRVQSVHVTVEVGYEGCGIALFMNQALTVPVSGGAASKPGDSGSPVVKVAGARITPVGLNFAGDGWHGVLNPAPAVFQALGVEIDTAPDDPPLASCF